MTQNLSVISFWFPLKGDLDSRTVLTLASLNNKNLFQGRNRLLMHCQKSVSILWPSTCETQAEAHAWSLNGVCVRHRQSACEGETFSQWPLQLPLNQILQEKLWFDVVNQQTTEWAHDACCFRPWCFMCCFGVLFLFRHEDKHLLALPFLVRTLETHRV